MTGAALPWTGRLFLPGPWGRAFCLKFQMKYVFFRSACMAVLFAVGQMAHAQDLAVKIDHESMSVGADGVTRITRFSERLVRRDDQSWLSRIIPAYAQEDAEHQRASKSHKHMDVNAAARWVARGTDGKLRVRIVDVHEKLVVDVLPTDYGNIGFDGRWSTAAQLVDPSQLQRMKVSSRSAPAGARWYEGGSPNHRVWLLWDETGQYPRRIESSNATGSQSKLMTVSREPMPQRLPWLGLASYAQKEYADLLD